MWCSVSAGHTTEGRYRVKEIMNQKNEKEGCDKKKDTSQGLHHHLWGCIFLSLSLLHQMALVLFTNCLWVCVCNSYVSTHLIIVISKWVVLYQTSNRVLPCFKLFVVSKTIISTLGNFFYFLLLDCQLVSDGKYLYFWSMVFRTFHFGSWL